MKTKMRFGKKIRIKDFKMLRSSTKHYRIFDATKSETLSPLDIYEMWIC
jgi:hypothetical protein